MTHTLDVIYNADCPICSAEIASYRAYADRRGLAIRFHPIDSALRADLGLSPDQAARRLHARIGGQVLSGVDAFAALWSAMPRLAWAGWLVRRPFLRPIARFAYDRIAAPLLYALHKRRQRP